MSVEEKAWKKNKGSKGRQCEGKAYWVGESREKEKAEPGRREGKNG